MGSIACSFSRFPCLCCKLSLTEWLGKRELPRRGSPSRGLGISGVLNSRLTRRLTSWQPRRFRSVQHTQNRTARGLHPRRLGQAGASDRQPRAGARGRSGKHPAFLRALCGPRYPLRSSKALFPTPRRRRTSHPPCRSSGGGGILRSGCGGMNSRRHSSHQKNLPAPSAVLSALCVPRRRGLRNSPRGADLRGWQDALIA